MVKITHVRKRDGTIVVFDESRIMDAIFKTLTATGEGDRKKAKRLANKVVKILARRFKKEEIPQVEQIQDIVEEILILEGLVKTAKAYILYREQRRKIREAVKVAEEAVDRLDQYLEKLDWEVQENANMAFSLQGLNHYGVSYIVKKYWLNKIYPKEIREANEDGDLHIHNLDALATYCCGWDLYDLLLKGFGGVAGKVESAPPKHFRTALGQLVNFFYTLQGECFSEDTQVLTNSGWKYFYEVTKDDKIFTLNNQTNEIELQKPIKFYQFDYNGELYNFKSKKLDLLVTPNHNMVVDQYCPHCKRGMYRRKFVKAKDFKVSEHFIPKSSIWKGEEGKMFILPGIEIFQYRDFTKPNNYQTLSLNGSQETFFSKGKTFGEVLCLPQIKTLTCQPVWKYEIKKIKPKKIIVEDWLAFFGFWLAEGYTSLRKRKRKGWRNPYYEYQVRISQNKGKKANEFENILKKLPFKYLKKQKGKKIEFTIRNKQLFLYLKQFGDRETKFIPKEIKNLSKEQLKILFDWMMKGDGYNDNGNIDYYTKSKRLADDFQEISLKLGWSANIYEKYKGKFKWYRVGISKRKHFKFRKGSIKKVKYLGKVYCLEVLNHTLYVRREGKACWSGNSAGAQAVSNFDTLLAPFIRYDNLNYQQVKQALQEFLFNMAIPTRVGFQSLAWDELVVIKHRGKIKFIEIGKLIDEEFKKNSHRVIEQHPQSYAVQNYDNYYTLSFDSQGKATWAKVKAFVRHKIPKNSKFVKIKTNRGRAKVSPAHSFFSFSRFDNVFNPKPTSAQEVGVARDYRHLSPENHLLALGSLTNLAKKEELDLVELIDEFPQLYKNIFVRINPTKTVNQIKENVLKEYQGFLPFWREFGFKDRGVWQQWLKNRSVRYDVWRKFSSFSLKAQFKLKNSEIWYPRFLKKKELANFVKLCAWYVSEGHAGISLPFYLSQGRKKVMNRKEIIELLRSTKSLGQIEKSKGFSQKGNKVQAVDKISAKGLLNELISWSCGFYAFNKIIPWFIFDLTSFYQKIFIESLLKGGALEYEKHWDYSTTSPKLSLSLGLLLAQNDYYFSVYSKEVSEKNKNWRDQYIVRIYKEKELANKNRNKRYKVGDFEARVCLKKKEFNYDKEFEYDISVDLPQENFVGGTGLLVFHNTPFSNVTIDIKPSAVFAKQPVIIGGKLQDKTYGEFQEEMNIFNRAFYEVMIAGDSKGRVFTFPIPTLNITKDFDWDNPSLSPMWEATAKYGVNYFANYIKSEMKPEDIRALCCRLLLDKRELYNRGGGGLFGSGALTGCYDEKTEILTENGWKLFKDLTKEDRVFTLTQNNKIELHQPSKLFEYDYEGKMIHFKAKSVDLLVTPNHRMVVDHKRSLRRMFVEAKDFKPYQHYVPKGGIWQGEEKEYFELPPVVIMSEAGPIFHFSEEELEPIRKMKREGKSIYQLAENFNCNPVTVYNICTKKNYSNRERLRLRYETLPLKIKMDDWLKFFGFWIAEGCTDNEKRVVISQTNKGKREEIKKVLDTLPFNYYEERDNFIICNKQLWSYLRQFGNKYEKFIPKEIKNLNKRQLKILFDWIIKGDGHVRKIRKTNGQINYRTSLKKLADDLQEIILKLGWMATLKSYKGKICQIRGRKIKPGIMYEIGVQKTKHYVFQKKLIRERDYKGKVYCCEVPNHTVFVRRNGKVLWCGNSIGVVTVNMPRIGYLSKTKKEFLERLEKVMDLAKMSLEIKRKVLENFIEKGLYPYSRFYLQGIKKMRDQYYGNHFSTIGLVGMNEAILNFTGDNIASKRGRRFALEVLDFMRERLVKYQKETGNLYNLEATPAESTATRLAMKDKEKYSDIITAGTKKVPFYTNSSQLPVNYTDDIFEALKLQDELQCRYSGGTVLHLFLGEKVSDIQTVKSLIKKIFENFKLPYLTITPTFSICPNHGYLEGEHFECPKCIIKQPCEVYSRIVGYLRPVQQWNKGKQEEFKKRKEFKLKGKKVVSEKEFPKIEKILLE